LSTGKNSEVVASSTQGPGAPAPLVTPGLGRAEEGGASAAFLVVWVSLSGPRVAPSSEFRCTAPSRSRSAQGAVRHPVTLLMQGAESRPTHPAECGVSSGVLQACPCLTSFSGAAGGVIGERPPGRAPVESAAFAVRPRAV